ncbi:MAG: DUF116 domain-containing protein [Euryarchaeota archaeon]|nr:DUF116 domain-containing protein [Euryarchaeota archaeon]
MALDFNFIDNFAVTFDLIGKIAIFLLFFLFSLIVFGVVLFLISFKTGRYFLPGIFSGLIDAFHSPIRYIVEKVGLNPKYLNAIIVDVKNSINAEKFKKAPVGERVIVLPQCLRSIDCPAKLSSKKGIYCIGCGLCYIGEFKEKTEALGYRVFILPGGTFVKRILKRLKPQAVLGVACFKDVFEGMRICEKAGIPVQGVLLKTTGCVETLVDWDEIWEKVYLGVDEDGVQGSEGEV